ncbi:MAG TPA: LapA family protein [Bacillota bacterium]|nr:LapA family protein [Bacillota bacterium]
MKNQLYVILLIIFIIIVSIFALMNIAIVEVNYIFWSGESPLILVILFSLLMGGIITIIAGSVKFYRMKNEIKTLTKRNNELERQLGMQNIKNDTSDRHDEVKTSHLEE